MKNWVTAASVLVALGAGTTMYMVGKMTAERALANRAPTKAVQESSDEATEKKEVAKDSSRPDLGRMPMPTLPPPPVQIGGATAPPGKPSPAKLPESIPSSSVSNEGLPEAVQDQAEIKLRREGTRIVDTVGIFRQQGRRWVFVPDQGEAHWALLENQLLQRLEDRMERQANGESLTWKVTGTITEYRNTNYLLLERVVAK